MDLMLEHDSSRSSVVRKKSIVPVRPISAPHPPDHTVPRPPTADPNPSPLRPPTSSSSSPTTSTSSSEVLLSSSVEGMKISVDTTDTTNRDKEEGYEFVHESNYLRSMLDADTPVETMATYAATKTKLHGADEVYSRIMSLNGDGDSDDEDD